MFVGKEHSVRLTCSRTCVRTWVYKDRAKKISNPKISKISQKCHKFDKISGRKIFKISLSKRSSILIGRKARVNSPSELALSLMDERWVPADEYVQDRRFMIMRIYYQQV